VLDYHIAIAGNIINAALCTVFIASRDSTYAGVVAGVGYITRHAATYNRAIVVQAGNTTQIGVINAIVAGLDIRSHPAVLYGTVVFTAYTAYLTRITYVDIAVYSEVPHTAFRMDMFEETLAVGAETAVVNLVSERFALKLSTAAFILENILGKLSTGAADILLSGLKDVLVFMPITFSMI
jgi:hypothetical protein